MTSIYMNILFYHEPIIWLMASMIFISLSILEPELWKKIIMRGQREVQSVKKTVPPKVDFCLVLWICWKWEKLLQKWPLDNKNAILCVKKDPSLWTTNYSRSNYPTPDKRHAQNYLLIKINNWFIHWIITNIHYFCQSQPLVLPFTRSHGFQSSLSTKNEFTSRIGG